MNPTVYDIFRVALSLGAMCHMPIAMIKAVAIAQAHRCSDMGDTMLDRIWNEVAVDYDPNIAYVVAGLPYEIDDDVQCRKCNEHIAEYTVFYTNDTYRQWCNRCTIAAFIEVTDRPKHWIKEW